MEKLLNKIVKLSGYTISEIKGTCRKSELVAVRLLFAQEALKKGYHPTEVGKLINRDRSTIIQMKDYKPSRDYAELEKKYLKMTIGSIAKSIEYLAKVWVFTNLFTHKK